jgi:hypothetical protein
MTGIERAINDLRIKLFKAWEENPDMPDTVEVKRAVIRLQFEIGENADRVIRDLGIEWIKKTRFSGLTWDEGACISPFITAQELKDKNLKISPAQTKLLRMG